MHTRSSLLLALAAVFVVSLLIAGQAIQAQVIFPSVALPPGTPPPGVDLDVTFINRAPLYHAYCVAYPWNLPNMPGIPALCPGTETEQRWPAPGEVVTFTAHIVNKGTIASPPFAYRWTIDGNAVLSGTLGALAPSAEITTTYQWTWAHILSPDGQRLLDEHSVGFRADPDNAIAETYESNNQVTDRTDAMSFRINITPAMVAAYNLPVTDTLPYSAEDWLQKQIAMMNANFARSIYSATTPAGATLRVRIDLIEVSTSYPDDGRAHDGGWFVDADYRHGASAWYDPAADIDWALIHELCHQVSVIDLYVSNIPAANVNVINPWGRPVNFGFDWPNADLMGAATSRRTPIPTSFLAIPPGEHPPIAVTATVSMARISSIFRNRTTCGSSINSGSRLPA